MTNNTPSALKNENNKKKRNDVNFLKKLQTVESKLTIVRFPMMNYQKWKFENKRKNKQVKKTGRARWAHKSTGNIVLPVIFRCAYFLINNWSQLYYDIGNRPKLVNSIFTHLLLLIKCI